MDDNSKRAFEQFQREIAHLLAEAVANGYGSIQGKIVIQGGTVTYFSTSKEQTFKDFSN